MTDLSDPAIREAGARALYEEFRGWNQEEVGPTWFNAWDRIATELNPILQMVEIREQLRAGDDPGSETGNTNPDPASPDNAVQEGEE